MAGVGDLVDRAVALPPGPQLSATLARLPWEKVPNARLVEVLQARSRQLAHDQAELFAGMVEISHAVALADLPTTQTGEQAETDGRGGDHAGGKHADESADGDGSGDQFVDQSGGSAETVARTGEQVEWACHEIAAGLTWTPTATDREFGLATALSERLPLVFTALQRGDIDRGKARTFVEYLDPATGDLTEQQSRQLCARFVPKAPGLTTKQLSDRLYRALHAIDPELRRRRYQRAVQERGVALYLDRHTGTATLVGSGLPAAEAAAAAARLDRLVEAVKTTADGTAGESTANEGTADDSAGKGVISDEGVGDTSSESSAGAGSGAGPVGVSGHGRREGSDSRGTPASSTGSGQDPSAVDRWVGERVGTREGIEVRAGLSTLAGLDERPGEIPGLGPVSADVARAAAAAQRRGAGWRFAIVDAEGYLQLAGVVRRRPRTHLGAPDGTPTGSGAGRGGCGVASSSCT